MGAPQVPVFSFLLPAPRPPASAGAGHTPPLARPRPDGWAAAQPGIRRLSPAALRSGQGGLCSSPGEAPSSSSATCKDRGNFGSQDPRVQFDPTIQPARDPSGGAGLRQGASRALAAWRSGAPGREPLKVQVSGKEAEGVRAPVHSVGVLGTPCAVPGRRAPTAAAKRLGSTRGGGPVWWVGGPGAGSRPGAPDQGRGLGSPGHDAPDRGVG